ncbi:sperm-specific protein Don juan-like [Drosophila serrata]|uniref:sperm-specific protein Don juan-like n=1 Tax=Drosophila serrata TaxID=7274 RepID=UPI000A1CFBD3|nr:sperm-specific protein Don juan-like [Drosophila serrata]
MFIKSGLFLGRCTKGCLSSHILRPNFLVRSHHLANFKNAGIQDQRLGRRIDSPKKLEDGSIGIIHVQGQESANLVNPMQRRFLNDLELQQNRWLKEEKKNQDDLGSLTKQITMSAGAKDKGKSKGGKGDDKKKKEAAEKKKCAEMELKQKCADAAKKAEADKKKKEEEKKCQELADKEMCAKMAGIETDPCKKEKKDKKEGKKKKG